METKENMGVTIENATEYVSAIENAVKTGLGNLPKEQRAFFGFTFCDALRMVENSIEDYVIKKIQSGEIPPPSQEQVKKFVRQAQMAIEPKKYN